jgi:hypothetical protein
MEIGKKYWVIAEGYIPGKSIGPKPLMESHESACILNCSGSSAHVKIYIYYSDREPVGPYEIEVEAKRTKHVRFNNLNPHIPKDTEYSSVFISDMPIVVQHTRLDSRQAENALLSTIAYSQ